MKYNLNMSTLVLCALFLVFLSPAVTSECDINDVIKVSEKNDEYYALKQNNNCFLFSLTPAKITAAITKCMQLGGHLTDVEERKGNFLQNHLRQENFQGKDKEYWIGLLYNDDLDFWYWTNGAIMKLEDLSELTGLYPATLWNFCIVLGKRDLKWVGCSDEHRYICKLDLGCSQEVTSTENCTQRCSAFIGNHKSMNISLKSNPSNGTDNNDNHTSSAEGNYTTIGYSSGTYVEKDQCDCRSHTRKIDIKEISIIIALGVGFIILIVALGATCVVMLKYRKRLKNMESPPRISLVDILNVNKMESSSKRQNSSHQESPSELLYSNAEDVISAPKKMDRQAFKVADNTYNNNSAIKGVGESTATSTESLLGAAKADPSYNPENDEYTHLSRIGERMEASDSQQVYGIASATNSCGISSDMSPTYEQY